MKFKIGRLAEFFVIGVVVGIAEDLIAVYLSTGQFSFKIVWIVALVAIPFAVISELIVDYYKPFHSKKEKHEEARRHILKRSEILEED